MEGRLREVKICVTAYLKGGSMDMMFTKGQFHETRIFATAHWKAGSMDVRGTMKPGLVSLLTGREVQWREGSMRQRFNAKLKPAGLTTRMGTIIQRAVLAAPEMLEDLNGWRRLSSSQ